MSDTATHTYVRDRLIGRSVAAEIAYAGVPRQDVADAIGLDKGSFSRSVAGRRQWKASEILGIAEYLDIDVIRLLENRHPTDTPPRLVSVGGNHTDPSAPQGYLPHEWVTELLVAA